MSCEEELNALRQAERKLNLFRKQHSELPDSAAASGGSAEAAPEAETLQRLAELTADVADKGDAYNRCRGEQDGRSDVESLMRDASGAPLGGDAGPPM